MKSFSKTLTGILAGTFVILFIMTTALAFVLYNVEQSIFDAELYIQAFKKENVYQRFPDLTAQALAVAAQEADSGDPLAILRNFSEEEWSVFITELLPPAEIEILVEGAVRGIMDYLNRENDEVVLSLSSLKTHLGSPQGIDAIYGIMKAQPDCTPQQLTAMAMDQGDLMLCNPPDTFLLVDLQINFEATIEAAVLILPDQVTLISTDTISAQELQDLDDFRTIIRLSPLFPMLCLLMITIIIVRSLNDWLNWWGYPLWFAGLFSIAVIIVSGALATLLFEAFVAPVFPETIPPDLLDLLVGIFTTIAYDAVQPMVGIAGIMILIGLIMVAIALLFRKRLQENQDEAPNGS